MAPTARSKHGARGFFGISAEESAEERDAGGNVGTAIVARLTLDGQPAAVLDLFEGAEKLHPVDVAVAQRHFLSGAAGAGLPGVLGVRVNDAPAESLGAGVGIETVQEQVGGIEIDPQRAGVEAIEERGQYGTVFQSGFQREDGADAVAVTGERLQRFAQEMHPRILGIVRDGAGLHDDDARSQVETEGEDFLDVFEARLLILGRIKTAAQRTAERRQFQVVSAEQMAELAPAGLRQGVRRQIADRVHLHAGNAQPAGFRQRAPQRQTQRFQTYANLETIHDGHRQSWRDGEGTFPDNRLIRITEENGGPQET